jgi:hypothetical protein
MESIYSLFIHIQRPDRAVQSSFDEGLSIIFPTFRTKAIIGHDDIYLDATPMNFTSFSMDQTSVHSEVPISSTSLDYCRHVTQFNEEVSSELNKVDGLLLRLQEYYNDVKTCRQLNMEVPAGFRQQSNLQRDINHYLNTTKTLTSPDNSQDVQQILPTSIPDLASSSSNTTSLDTTTNSSSSMSVLILRCVDKPSSSIPSRMTYTEDFIRASVGFRRIDTIKSHLSDLYQSTVSIDSLPPDAVLDPGDFSTMKKSARNTNPVPRPDNFGDVMHMDIVFGPKV